MSKTIEQWVDELKDADLPVLEHSLQTLRDLASNPEQISAGQISSAVLHDPFLTIRILRDANTSVHNRFDTDITTIEHAVMMLGIKQFFDRYTDLPTIETRYQDKPDILAGIRRTLFCSYHAAYQAWELAILRQDVRAEEVFVAALFCSMGEPLLWAYFPEYMIHLETIWQKNLVPYEQAQRETLGCLITDIQQKLAEAWQLPELLRAFLDQENMMRPRVIGLDLALSIARHAEKGWYRPEIQSMLALVAAVLRISIDEVTTQVHATAVRAARQWEWYQTPAAAAWLPMLPGLWPEEEEEEAFLLRPHPHVIEETIQSIKTHSDHSLTLNQMVDIALTGMKEGLGLNRVVFCLITSDRKRIKAKYVRTMVEEERLKLHQFEFHLEDQNLFARVMTKPQGLWLHETNRQKFMPLISPELKPIIGSQGFFAMSLYVRQHPVGFIYADRLNNPLPLDEDAYSGFKQICVALSNGLGYLAKG